jgi:putative addiction module component (TIGR02574 family)
MRERNEEVESAWAEEIERRVRQIDSGEVKTIPWEEVRAKAYARLHERQGPLMLDEGNNR